MICSGAKEGGFWDFFTIGEIGKDVESVTSALTFALFGNAGESSVSGTVRTACRCTVIRAFDRAFSVKLKDDLVRSQITFFFLEFLTWNLFGFRCNY